MACVSSFRPYVRKPVCKAPCAAEGSIARGATRPAADKGPVFVCLARLTCAACPCRAQHRSKTTRLAVSRRGEGRTPYGPRPQTRGDSELGLCPIRETPGRSSETGCYFPIAILVRTRLISSGWSSPRSVHPSVHSPTENISSPAGRDASPASAAPPQLPAVNTPKPPPRAPASQCPGGPCEVLYSRLVGGQAPQTPRASLRSRSYDCDT